MCVVCLCVCVVCVSVRAWYVCNVCSVFVCVVYVWCVCVGVCVVCAPVYVSVRGV